MTEEELNTLEAIVIKAVDAREQLTGPYTLGPAFKILMNESIAFQESLVPSTMFELIKLARKGLASGELYKALVDAVETFDARPDMAKLMGPHELSQYKNARAVLLRAVP